MVENTVDKDADIETISAILSSLSAKFYLNLRQVRLN